MLIGFSDHTTNSGSTSAEWKSGRGGRATMARLTSSTGLPRPGRLPPREEAPPRPRGATTGVAVCLRGRPRPLLGGGEPGPSWRAFPFSVAENLRIGTMGIAASNEAREKKQAEQEEMSDRGSAPLLIYSGRMPTGDPHDHR